MARKGGERCITGERKTLTVSQFRGIVVLTQVAKEDVLQSFVVEALYGHRAFLIR